MTNKKLKNVQENLWARDLCYASSRNILTGYACLEQLGVKSEVIRQMDKDYNQYVREGERMDNDGVSREMSERMVSNLGLEIEDFTRLIRVLNKNLLQRTPMQSREKTEWFITFNLILFFAHINRTLGYGAVRLERVMDRMKEYKGDPDKDGERILCCKFEDADCIPDIDSLGYKEKKINDEELEKLKIEMNALRIIQSSKGVLVWPEGSC